MFQLIIAILSIALIATLAIASVYYGGDAFTSGSAKAGAATMVSQAQQISAANVLFQSTNAGANAADVTTLVSDNYLQSAPQMPESVGDNLDLDQDSGVVYGQVANESICSQINDQLGITVVPDLDAATGATMQEKMQDAFTQQYACGTMDDGGNPSYQFGYM